MVDFLFKNIRIIFILSLVSFSLNLEAADTINQGLDLFQKKQFEKALPYLEASHSKNRCV